MDEFQTAYHFVANKLSALNVEQAAHFDLPYDGLQDYLSKPTHFHVRKTGGKARLQGFKSYLTNANHIVYRQDTRENNALIQVGAVIGHGAMLNQWKHAGAVSPAALTTALVTGLLCANDYSHHDTLGACLIGSASVASVALDAITRFMLDYPAYRTSQYFNAENYRLARKLDDQIKTAQPSQPDLVYNMFTGSLSERYQNLIKTEVINDCMGGNDLFTDYMPPDRAFQAWQQQLRF